MEDLDVTTSKSLDVNDCDDSIDVISCEDSEIISNVISDLDIETCKKHNSDNSNLSVSNQVDILSCDKSESHFENDVDLILTFEESELRIIKYQIGLAVTLTFGIVSLIVTYHELIREPSPYERHQEPRQQFCKSAKCLIKIVNTPQHYR